MRNIHRYLSKNEKAKRLLFDCIDQLVRYGKTSFYSLSDSEKNEIVGLLIKALDKVELFECLVEHKDADMVMGQLANYLISQNEEAKHGVTDLLSKHAIEYYEDVLDEYFKERAEEQQIFKIEDARVFNSCRETHYL